jgi:hypothetical protein
MLGEKNMKKLTLILPILLLSYARIQTMDPSAKTTTKTYNQEATNGILKLIQDRKAGETIDFDALKKLLAANADPNAHIGEKNYSLLHWAASLAVPSVEFYQILIAAGADPLSQDYKDRTPYQFFAKSSVFEKLKKQIKKHPEKAALTDTLKNLEAVRDFLGEAEKKARASVSSSKLSTIEEGEEETEAI